MKNTKYFISLLLVSSFLLFASVSHAYTFNFDLSLGSSGQDVYELQKFLNSYSPQTVIAQTGIGSPGNETTYFGTLTRNALQIFQNLNFDQILKPANLTSGAGYFGQSTRNFVNIYTNPPSNSTAPFNSSAIKQTTSSGTNLLDQSIQQQTKYTNFLIMDQRTVKNEGKLLVTSVTPISNLKFLVDDKEMKKKCPDKYFCEITVNVSQIGTKTLKLSDKTFSPEKIKVVDKNTKTPSVKITKLQLDQENTIKGSNLTSQITAHTIFGSYKVQTSNDSFKLKISSKEVGTTKDMKGPFYIENSDGIISDIMLINYEI